MMKRFWLAIATVGANLWEKNGFWIDKRNAIANYDYKTLPLLGKVGYKIMAFGLKMAKVDLDRWYHKGYKGI